MITQKRILGLVGAGALLMGMMLGTTGIAAAGSDTVTWTGNGVTDGVLNDEICDANNTAYLFWVLSPADNISAAELWINGVDQGAMQPATDNGKAAFQLQTAFFDLDTISAQAVITTTGDTGNGLKLKISHGCAGETSSSTTSFSSTVESTTDSSSSTTTFNSTVESTTDTLPPTDTIGSTGSGQQSSGLWLLIAGLGVLLGSAIVLAPARAKTRR
jgi:hypothetical protein